MLAAAWLTAVSTAVLGAGAIVTAVFAILAFRKQSAEVGLLQVQTGNEETERRREADERRRLQAAQLYVTQEVEPGNAERAKSAYMAGRSARTATEVATVHNVSGLPVYDARVHWVAANGAQAGAEDQLGTLGPHSEASTRRSLGSIVPSSAEELAVVAYFRDAAGERWTLTPDGKLASVSPLLPAGAPQIATMAIADIRAAADLATPE
jgi:hypothetical protein